VIDVLCLLLSHNYPLRHSTGTQVDNFTVWPGRRQVWVNLVQAMLFDSILAYYGEDPEGHYRECCAT
jgi:hypothetical protein